MFMPSYLPPLYTLMVCNLFSISKAHIAIANEGIGSEGFFSRWECIQAVESSRNDREGN